MAKDIHITVFDEGTLTKLAVLRKYLQGWFPVFLNDRKYRWNKVEIYDFFAGEGYDAQGNHGISGRSANYIKSPSFSSNGEGLRRKRRGVCRRESVSPPIFRAIQN